MNQLTSLIDPEGINNALRNTWLQSMAADLQADCDMLLDERPHGDRRNWLDAIEQLPDIGVASTCLACDAVACLPDSVVGDRETALLKARLMQLHPWRKGPFRLFGLDIDTEWRSNLKWQRVKNNISALSGRTVLDVGCGNGYYLYRMLGEGAKLALGIDPTQLFLAQFLALQRYLSAERAVILPMKSEDFLAHPKYNPLAGFDTIFSMGIYYHRRNPDTHLAELARLMRPGGELVLETLVIAGEGDRELAITGRYAQMRNVWSVPTIERLSASLSRAGFAGVRLIDVTPTTINEQRATDWMRFDSLEQFLDPGDPEKTIEGYPAPLRATLTAQKPELPES